MATSLRGGGAGKGGAGVVRGMVVCWEWESGRMYEPWVCNFEGKKREGGGDTRWRLGSKQGGEVQGGED